MHTGDASIKCLVNLLRGVLGTAVLGVAVLAAAATASADPVRDECHPSIIDLGDPLGGGFSFADAIDPTGTIVVGTAARPDGLNRAVEWRHGQATDLGVVGRYDESFAHGVSSDGTVVGELNYRQRKSAPFVYYAGRLHRLPGLGGDFGYADQINDDDVIVGTASDAAGNPHAVVWTDRGRTVHDLGLADGDVASFASGINRAGTAVGDSDDADGNERPAVFAQGEVRLLSTRKSIYGSAEDVNDRADVIGISFLPDGQQHATSWPAGRSTGHDLGALAGGTFASLVDLDNRGAAVGGGNSGGHKHVTQAIFWPGRGALEVLRPLSHRLYRDFSVARGLDDNDDAVGGSATAAGDVHATRWTCAAAQAVPARTPA